MQYDDEIITIAEDHERRSRHICELVKLADQSVMPRIPIKSSIPKTIVQFWHDEREIPEDVQSCFSSWDSLETKGFIRFIFNDNSAQRFIERKLGQLYLDAFNRCHHPAMRCDYFRLCYIFVQGGFYIDADETYQGAPLEQFAADARLKLQPLCYDKSSNSMVDPRTFLDPDQHSPDWIYYVNNNPIIAPCGHPIVRIALNRATRLLLNEEGVLDIQSTTGPGNLSASLVMHSLTSNCKIEGQDFVLIPDWTSFSISPWPLSYRNDQRNWRLWNPQRNDERL